MNKQLGIVGAALLVGACGPQEPVRMDSAAAAAASATYYDTVDESSSAALRTTLHDVIDDHTRFPFTSTALDTWDILELADEDPSNASNILDVYRNASYTKAAGGNTSYNREHTWPSSFGFPNDNSTNYPYSDTHGLFLSDSGYNSGRNNRPYRMCNSSCTEDPTVFNNGQGGGSGSYPGNSNWREGANDTGTWETWIGRRGDVARAVMYLDLRYEGGSHGGTGAAEPNLILTDDQALISASNTGANLSVAYMGIRSVLLRWHIEDPPDATDMARNDVVFSFQGNRNPFIDHPEWVACAFDGVCGDVTAPVAPSGLVGVGANGRVDLDWADHADPGLIGYFVYRAATSGGPHARLNGALATASAYSDGSAQNGTTYFYVVRAVDLSGNASPDSAEVSATPSMGGGGSSAWINELHYDNSGSDVGEQVEIAGPAGTVLTGWSVVGYNGSGGAPYQTISLSGTIPDQGGCMGTLAFAFSGMQNGSPDGLALVDASGTVLELISYEGVLVATSGPASGMTSVDISVSETTSSPVGHSLQLSGAGSSSGDFTWQPPAPNTSGAVNAGQTFTGCGGGCVTDGDCDDGLFCNGPEACVAAACQPGTPASVDDGVACTTDSCDEANDVIVNAPSNAACDDGLFCDGVETCDAVAGCLPGSDPCAGGTCDEPTDQCVAGCVNDGDCNDGLFCNGAEVCSAGTCQAGSAPPVDDGVSCTVDSCDEVANTVVHAPSDALCDNGLFCDGAELCDAVLDCQTTAAPDCSGLDDACNVGLCDEPSDQCVASPLGAGTTCDDGDACTSADQCDGAGVCGGTNVCGGVAVETVTLTSGASWSTVALASSYASMVVVCSPNYDAAQGAAVVRVRNAAGTSFELAVVRADGSNATVAGVDVQCLVVEEGVYTAAQDGVTMEAVRYDSTVTDRRGSFAGQSQSLVNAYSNPVVVGQVMSANDPGWSVFWSRGGSASAPPSASDVRTGKHVGEDPDTTRATEVVGYLVIESGSGTMGGRAYIAAVGADTVRGVGDGPPYSYGLSGLSSASVGIVSQAGMDGNNGGWAILYGANAVSATTLQLAIDEDQVRDSERSHSTEQVAYIVFE